MSFVLLFVIYSKRERPALTVGGYFNDPADDGRPHRKDIPPASIKLIRDCIRTGVDADMLSSNVMLNIRGYTEERLPEAIDLWAKDFDQIPYGSQHTGRSKEAVSVLFRAFEDNTRERFLERINKFHDEVMAQDPEEIDCVDAISQLATKSALDALMLPAFVHQAADMFMSSILSGVLMEDIIKFYSERKEKED